MFPVYLASTSPRRQALLKQLGIPFTVLARPVDEDVAGKVPFSRLVEILAYRKAEAAAGEVAGGVVIGADTVVACRGQVLGKPSSAEEAEKMLGFLSGKEHEVFTGLAVIQKPSLRKAVAHERTKVRFRPLTREEIKRYVATGEPMDKAGAYAIQGLGAIFIEKIEGCYFNVVGLPLALLARLLREFGLDVLNANAKSRNGTG
ncbi:MAG: Maf family protein [Desulfotomaculales bacterium]